MLHFSNATNQSHHHHHKLMIHYISGEGGTPGLARTSVSGTLKQIVRTEGIAALYSGIVPGLQRQMAFSAIRIGAYEHVREYYKELTGVTGGLGLMAVRIGAGVTTGDFLQKLSRNNKL